jgi:hypothetical protein
MYTTTRNIAGDTLMTCKDCGHAVSMNKMCETPLQSATDILKHMATHNLKHMATHNASHAFASVERVTRLQLEKLPITELAQPLDVPARVDRSECPIARLSPLLPEFGLSGFSLDQLMQGEALLTM